ncbi:MAG: NUDIX domain-containing protein [Fimbriimonadaceae bacterium]|nr:NUDIX domain-containing protein [Fimbriimonadaceae bacterium]
MRFPAGKYGHQKLAFHPAPFRAPFRAFAALVFPWSEDQVLLCNIEDRGWCIPSGRVEPDESSIEAAAREAREEAGAVLSDILYLGCYRISSKGEVRYADLYTALVVELHDIPPEFESKGRQFVTLGELPGIYHLWNPLTKALFEHSFECMSRHIEARNRFQV